MNFCARCRHRYPSTQGLCPVDGTRLEPEPDARLGQVVGGAWRLIERIGTGGMATVYRAWDEALDREAALKILETTLARDPLQRARFLREMRATRRIRHRNVVEVIDCGEDSDSVYLAMELLRGRSLAEHISAGPMSAREAVELGAQVASALARAHELQIVHRDVKPENVFLTHDADGRVCAKVLDFGLAWVRGEARLTASGSVFGTPEYMSPEMTRGRSCTAASDLYALGVMLFEMLTGAPPFEGTMAELLIAHSTLAPPKLSARMASVDPELEHLVARLLEKSPEARYADAGRLVDELTAIAARLPPSPKMKDSVAPLRSRATLRVTVTLELWTERIRALRDTIATLESDDGASAALGELESAHTAATLLAEQVRRDALALVAQESETDKAREKIVQSLDGLTREARENARAVEHSQSAVAEARAKEDQALAGLLRSFGGPDEVEATEAAGRSAVQWRELRSVQETLAKDALALRKAALDLARRRSVLQSELEALEVRAEAEQRARREALAHEGSRLNDAYRELAVLAEGVFGRLPDGAARRALMPTVQIPPPR